MIILLQSIGMSIVTAIVSGIATHYHFTVDQSNQLTTDILGAVGIIASAAGTAYVHWRALLTPPTQGAGK